MEKNKKKKDKENKMYKKISYLKIDFFISLFIIFT
jgi:hypothetical protein